MKKVKFLSKNTIYFIGIGGISMSGLAKIVKLSGKNVIGSDISTNDEVVKLKKMGVKINNTQVEGNITNDIDLVVYSGAIKSDNPEILKANKLGIPTLERSEFLGELSRQFDNVIAIAGTHGKTTTTALIGHIFNMAGLNPTVHIGGESVNLGSNTVIGGSKYFIVEACEYRNSFGYLKPSLSVITNIESDHLDYYKTYKNLHNAFQDFANNSRIIVINKGEKINHITSIKCGIDYKVKNVIFENNGYNFDVVKNGKKWLSLRLNMIGKFNIDNALKGIIVADYYGIDKDIISSAISSFKGVERRFELLDKINNTPIICDYAHHPTEIKCSMDGINEIYKNALYIFQPHTYSRTLTLLKDFVKVLQSVQNLIIFKTYPAREEKIAGGDGVDLHLQLKNSLYADNINDLIDYLKDKINLFDCVVILGAGDLAINFRKHINKIKI